MSATRLTALAAAAALASTAAAQGRYLQTQRNVQTKTVEGEVKAVQGPRVIVDVDGQTGPIPVDRNTQLNVTARGDAGFLTPGAVVVVSGTLRPDGTVAGGWFTLHPNAQETVTPTTRKVNAADPQVTVAGRLVSLEPFVIRTIDPIAVVRPDETNVGAFAPGGIDVSTAGAKSDLTLTVKLRDGKPKDVSMNLGSALALVEPGDTASMTFREDNPRAAWRVSIRKAEPMKSEAPKADGGKKSDGGKTAEAGAKGEESKAGDEKVGEADE